MLGQEPQISPGKDPTGKLGQNFWQNFCNHIIKAKIPNWGKIFVKIFAISGSIGTFQTGAIFERER
jgi:hypothetical protein